MNWITKDCGTLGRVTLSQPKGYAIHNGDWYPYNPYRWWIYDTRKKRKIPGYYKSLEDAQDAAELLESTRKKSRIKKKK